MARHHLIIVSVALLFASYANASLLRDLLDRVFGSGHDGGDNGGVDPPPCAHLDEEPGWVCWDQSCYLRLPDTHNYDDARHQCASQCKSSDLVVINSPEEDVFLQRTFDQFWVGCSDKDNEGHWHCIDHMGLHYDETTGQTDGYWPWYDGHEPDGGSAQNCAHHEHGATHTEVLLHDADCADTHTTVCEVHNNPDYHYVRLVNDAAPPSYHTSTKGRVEIHNMTYWGSVCDDSFDILDAEVVCHTLGFPSAIAAHCCAEFGEGAGEILLDDLDCEGNETSLLQCHAREFGAHNCFHFEDAGVSCDDTVRLVGSNGALRPNKGRVEVYVHDQWGTVCDDSWDDRDATVVCRQLGYTAGKVGTFAGEGHDEVLLDDVNCAGTEDSLLHCVYSGVGHHNCQHNEDASVLCGLQVRLADGSSSSEGRVELLYNGEWGTVCDDLWDHSDADVVCKQLGFKGAVEATLDARFGEGTGPILLDNVICNGDEAMLTECGNYRLGEHDCTHGEDAGVICLASGNIRLVDGRPGSGRVEVFKNDAWGTVCDDNWEIADANIVCQQLGYHSARQAPLEAHFGQGSGEIFMDQVSCDGTEDELLDCAYADTHDCTHAEDASVVCNTYNELRLAGGRTPNEGRVEIYNGEEWDPICGNEWDLEDATVACRQIGYSGAIAAFQGNNVFGVGTGQMLLDHVECTGEESALIDCLHVDGGDDCDASNQASVICAPNVRIVDGPAPNIGRVEIFENDEWGTVCDDHWDMHEAIVVCHQLGFSSAQYVTFLANFGQGTGPIHYDDLQCTGEEDALSQCVHSGLGNSNCGHHEDAGVVCSPPVRLAGSETPSSGRVEVFANGAWGTVCDDQWSIEEANVVCRQLHFGVAERASVDAEFGHGAGPILLDDVACSGSEWSLFNCTHLEIGENNCGPADDAGVVCHQPAQDILRLNGTTKDGVGRVEVYTDNHWGTICDDHFDMRDAHVICRQLGFPSAIKFYTGAHFGEGSGRVVFDDLGCVGTERAIGDCARAETHDCGHNEDVGVWCAPKVSLIGALVGRGLVRVYHDGVWGTVCDDDFDITDGNVVCNELGFPGAAKVIEAAAFGEGVGQIVLDDVHCDGTEHSILDCPHREFGEHNCAHHEDASVICEKRVRLANGTTPLEGRVEIFSNGTWGTVCDDGWDIADANVLCRQMGYPEAIAAFSDAHFGEAPADMEIAFDEVECRGTENELNECAHIHEHNCKHDEDAGVQCANNVRLVDPDGHVDNGIDGHATEKRVELFVLGMWRSLYVAHESWNLAAANLICKGAGYHSVIASVTNEFLSHETHPFKLQTIQCPEEAESIFECFYDWHRGAELLEAAHVICQHEPSQVVRLVNGRTLNEGRVEVRSSPQAEWGSVCDDDFGMTDAGVVCRQLGYPSALYEFSGAHFGSRNGSGEVVMDNVECSGDEGAIQQCPHTSDSASIHCDHEEESVICEPNVRLADGPVASMGRLEVYVNGHWGTVCDDSFDMNVANVVCKQLGFEKAVLFTPGGKLGPGTGPIHLDDVHCNGDEATIFDCPSSGLRNHNCHHNEDVGVICSAPVRLAGTQEGRVEIFKGGAWGTICDDHWDINEANIVCRQLGFGRAIVAADMDVDYGKGQGPILLDDLECTADDDTLFTCPHADFVDFQCGHHDDAGVRCEDPTYETVRLAGGGVDRQGRLEILKDGTWGTICNHNFNQRAGSIVCRSLGYPRALQMLSFGPGEGPIYYHNVSCLGSEKSLADCRHDIQHNCAHADDVGIVCAPKINLIGDRLPSSGMLLIYHNHVFGKICAGGWDMVDAQVTCTHLGFPSALDNSAAGKVSYEFTDTIMGDVHCDGSEANLFDCPHTETGAYDCSAYDDEAASVTCEHNVRLVDGEDHLEGRVEIYVNAPGAGVSVNPNWYTVCDDMWDINDAHVVCRGMGFPGAVQAFEGSHFAAGSAPILLDDLNCHGSEESLLYCPSLSGPGVHNCESHEQAGVRCQQRLRLVEGATQYDGRLEAYVFDDWRQILIKEDHLAHMVADGICHNLGYDSARLVEYHGRSQNESATPFKVDNIDCMDDLECSYTMHTGSEALSSVWLVCRPVILARLADGNKPNEGRVEVSVNDGAVWGTVCDDGWDLDNANVTCHQLGFPSAFHAGSDAEFGPGTGPILLDDVHCDGTEQGLTYCDHASIGVHNCGHSEDASVTCQPRVRLVDGNAANEGRVEVYINGIWGTVCNHGWDSIDALVVCQELGYDQVTSATAQFGLGTGDILMDNVSCHSSDRSLVNCDHDDILGFGCGHNLDAGVICGMSLSNGGNNPI